MISILATGKISINMIHDPKIHTAVKKKFERDIVDLFKFAFSEAQEYASDHNRKMEKLLKLLEKYKIPQLLFALAASKNSLVEVFFDLEDLITHKYKDLVQAVINLASTEISTEDFTNIFQSLRKLAEDKRNEGDNEITNLLGNLNILEIENLPPIVSPDEGPLKVLKDHKILTDNSISSKKIDKLKEFGKSIILILGF